MTGVLTLAKGKVIAKHWRITKRLGKGSFGAVYQVKHIHNREEAALKVEVIRKDGQASVLKLEAHILRRLAHCHLFANVIQTGKKSTYSYMVMSLLGASLDTLIGKSGSICTVSTQIRVGINALCALKALHDRQCKISPPIPQLTILNFTSTSQISLNYSPLSARPEVTNK
ncbi:hypothetical protein Q1695_003186 [Nippostrongylus brasiliensis]|nr:hypothetical protein Q1695_003186 [Nippostrongylus brasiliensis]